MKQTHEKNPIIRFFQGELLSPTSELGEYLFDICVNGKGNEAITTYNLYPDFVPIGRGRCTQCGQSQVEIVAESHCAKCYRLFDVERVPDEWTPCTRELARGLIYVGAIVMNAYDGYYWGRRSQFSPWFQDPTIQALARGNVGESNVSADDLVVSMRRSYAYIQLVDRPKLLVGAARTVLPRSAAGEPASTISPINFDLAHTLRREYDRMVAETTTPKQGGDHDM
jgi:hypothetical protein